MRSVQIIKTADYRRDQSAQLNSTQLNSTGSENVQNFSTDLNSFKFAALSWVELSWVGLSDHCLWLDAASHLQVKVRERGFGLRPCLWRTASLRRHEWLVALHKCWKFAFAVRRTTAICSGSSAIVETTVLLRRLVLQRYEMNSSTFVMTTMSSSRFAASTSLHMSHWFCGHRLQLLCGSHR